MGVSLYFEVWPDALARQLTVDSSAWAAFRVLWGHGAGMHWWFDVDQEELDEILEEVPSDGVSSLRETMSRATQFSSAFLDKSGPQHEAILCDGFSDPGASSTAHLAIVGGGLVGHGSRLRVVTPVQCAGVHRRLVDVDLTESVRRLARQVAGGHSDEARLRDECEQLAVVYADAARHGHGVIHGSGASA